MADERPSGGAASPELTIFISYRRADTRADAGRLYDALSRRFGRDQLFMDVDSLMPGQDWVAAVEKAVAQSDVLLAVIGDEWSTVVDAAGRRRIEDDLDRVRLEIEAALKLDKPVIPVLFGDAHMPDADELPDTLQALRRRHAMRVAHDNFRADLEPLVRSLHSIEATKREKLGLPRRTDRGGRAARVETPPAASHATPPHAATKVRPPIVPPPAPPSIRPKPAALTPTPTPKPAPSAVQSKPVQPMPAQPTSAFQQPVVPRPAQPAYQQPTAYAQPAPQYGQSPQWQQPAQPVYQPSPYGQPYGQPGYPGQWGVQKTGASANPLSIVAMILGVIALLLYPVIFGPAGIIVGAIGKSRREPWSTAAIVMVIVCMIIGFVLGAMVALSNT